MYYLIKNNFENLESIKKILGEPHLNKLSKITSDYIIIVNLKNKKWSTTNTCNITAGKYKILEFCELIKIIRKEKLDEIYE